MPRGNDLVGLPVIVGPEYKRLGRIQKVLLSKDGAFVCGLQLSGGGWLQNRRVLDFRAVKAVGTTHLLAEEVYLAEDTVTRCCEDLHGMPVLGPGGDEVGLLDDVYFDARSGRVTALQLSQGFVDDLLSGKEIVAVDRSIYTGEAAIFLDGPGDFSGGAGSHEVSEL